MMNRHAYAPVNTDRAILSEDVPLDRASDPSSAPAHLLLPEGFSVIDALDAPTSSTSFGGPRLGERKDRRFPRKATLLNLYSRAGNRQERLSEVITATAPWAIDIKDEIAVCAATTWSASAAVWSTRLRRSAVVAPPAALLDDVVVLGLRLACSTRASWSATSKT